MVTFENVTSGHGISPAAQKHERKPDRVTYDIVVVGAGMAGASIAAELAPHAKVLILEREDRAGYHATGRSAAFWSESYGGPLVQPLTTASGSFLCQPPSEFAEHSFLAPRGALHIAEEEGEAALQALQAEFAGTSVELRVSSPQELQQRITGLRRSWRSGVIEESCSDIDVAALHQAYLRSARANGATLMVSSQLERAEGRSGTWYLTTANETFASKVLVNAAGAWGDTVAQLAGVRRIGLQPLRRTMVQLRVDPPADPNLPLVIDALGRFYFKPEAGGRVWLSPHDETPCDPCDSAPEEYDVALAIHRLQSVVDWEIERVEHSWAGLRTFAPDRLPVFGFDPDAHGFFWFAGQGGFGIQTAPAAAKLAASLILGCQADAMISGIDPAPYSPQRFAN